MDNKEAWQKLGVIICDKCHFKTSDEGLFQAHICRKAKNTSVAKAVVIYNKNTKQFSCSYCSFVGEENEFLVHLQKHLVSNPYKCSVCKKGFGSKRIIENHLRDEHPSCSGTFMLKVSGLSTDIIRNAKEKGKDFFTPAPTGQKQSVGRQDPTQDVFTRTQIPNITSLPLTTSQMTNSVASPLSTSPMTNCAASSLSTSQMTNCTALSRSTTQMTNRFSLSASLYTSKISNSAAPSLSTSTTMSSVNSAHGLVNQYKRQDVSDNSTSKPEVMDPTKLLKSLQTMISGTVTVSGQGVSKAKSGGDISGQNQTAVSVVKDGMRDVISSRQDGNYPEKRSKLSSPLQSSSEASVLSTLLRDDVIYPHKRPVPDRSSTTSSIANLHTSISLHTHYDAQDLKCITSNCHLQTSCSSSDITSNPVLTTVQPSTPSVNTSSNMSSSRASLPPSIYIHPPSTSFNVYTPSLVNPTVAQNSVSVAKSSDSAFFGSTSNILLSKQTPLPAPTYSHLPPDVSVHPSSTSVFIPYAYNAPIAATSTSRESFKVPKSTVSIPTPTDGLKSDKNYSDLYLFKSQSQVSNLVSSTPLRLPTSHTYSQLSHQRQLLSEISPNNVPFQAFPRQLYGTSNNYVQSLTQHRPLIHPQMNLCSTAYRQHYNIAISHQYNRKNQYYYPPSNLPPGYPPMSIGYNDSSNQRTNSLNPNGHPISASPWSSGIVIPNTPLMVNPASQLPVNNPYSTHIQNRCYNHVDPSSTSNPFSNNQYISSSSTSNNDTSATQPVSHSNSYKESGYPNSQHSEQSKENACRIYRSFIICDEVCYCLDCKQRFEVLDSFYQHVHLHIKEKVIDCCQTGNSRDCPYFVRILSEVNEKSIGRLKEIQDSSLCHDLVNLNNVKDSCNNIPCLKSEPCEAEVIPVKLEKDICETSDNGSIQHFLGPNVANSLYSDLKDGSILKEKDIIDDDFCMFDNVLKELSNNYFYKCCSIGCKFSCHQSLDLLIHMETAHGTEVEFHCPYCGYVGTKTTDMAHHYDDHFSNQSEEFSCSIIFDNSPPETVSNQILDVLISVLEKKSSLCDKCHFSCNKCDKKFSTVLKLKSHLQLSLLKTHSCKFCNAKFLDSKLFKEHLSQKHPGLGHFRKTNTNFLCCFRKKYHSSFLKMLELTKPTTCPSELRNFSDPQPNPVNAISPSTFSSSQTVERSTMNDDPASTTLVDSSQNLSLTHCSESISGSKNVDTIEIPFATNSDSNSVSTFFINDKQLSAVQFSNVKGSDTSSCVEIGMEKKCLANGIESVNSNMAMIVPVTLCSESIAVSKNIFSTEVSISTPQSDSSDFTCTIDDVQAIQLTNAKENNASSFMENELKRKCFDDNGIETVGSSKILSPIHHTDSVSNLNGASTTELPISTSSFDSNSVFTTSMDDKQSSAVQSSCGNESIVSSCVEIGSKRKHCDDDDTETVDNTMSLTYCTESRISNSKNDSTPELFTSTSCSDGNSASSLLDVGHSSTVQVSSGYQSISSSDVEIESKRKCFDDNGIESRKLIIEDKGRAECPEILENEISKISHSGPSPSKILKSNTSEHLSNTDTAHSSLFSSTDDISMVEKETAPETILSLPISPKEPHVTHLTATNCVDPDEQHAKSGENADTDVVNNENEETATEIMEFETAVETEDAIMYKCNLCGHECEWNENLMQEHITDSRKHQYIACYYCHDPYFEERRLKNHIKYHHQNKPFRYNKLGISHIFSPKIDSKTTHVIGYSKKDVKVSVYNDCRTCLVAEKGNENEIHLDYCEEILVADEVRSRDCLDPSSPTDDFKSLEMKERKRKPKIFGCHHCNSFFTSVYAVKRHHKSLKDHKGYHIQWIDRTTGNIYSLSGRLLEGRTETPTKRYLCNLCRYRSDNRSSIHQHQDECHEHTSSAQVIKLCGFTRLRLLQKGMDPETEPPTSTSKGEPLSISTGADQSTKDIRKNPLRYACHLCSAVLESEFTLKYHLAEHGGFPHKNTLSIQDGVLICANCGYVARSNADLAEHVTTHVTDRRYACSLCRWESHTKKAIVVHIEKRHGNDIDAQIIDRQNKSGNMKVQIVNLNPVLILERIE